jgi:hypothetical protein
MGTNHGDDQMIAGDKFWHNNSMKPVELASTFVDTYGRVAVIAASGVLLLVHLGELEPAS